MHGLEAGLGSWTPNQSKCEMKMVLVSSLRAKTCGLSKRAVGAIVVFQALEACVVRPRNYSGLA